MLIHRPAAKLEIEPFAYGHADANDLHRSHNQAFNDSRGNHGDVSFSYAEVILGKQTAIG